MNFVKQFWWLLLLLVIVLAWWAYARRDAGPASRAVQTALDVEIDGGFAYVHTQAENRLEIAFLADTNVPGCKIDQLGTDLMVISGNIIEPASPPPGATFDLDNAVITFPDLESSNQPLAATRPSGRPNPNRPANPANAVEWEPLHWVARITDQYPASSLNPQWRGMVDGRMVLRGGTLIGMQPSDVIVNSGIFDFRNAAGSVYQQAITDKTRYTVEVPNDRVVILLAGAKSQVTRIVVTPRNPGEPVQLKVMGRHAQQTPASLPIGSPVDDFCSFYQLLQPVPPQTEWLMPFYLGDPGKPGQGQGNPGPFCPPTFYP